MGDTGGAFFKFCMQVIDLTKVLLEKPKGRACLTDGLFSQEYNENGVNRILILAIVPGANIQETHDLVSKVMELMNLRILNCKKIIHTGDQKYTNIITGCGSHTSSFPSPICFIFHKNLDDPCPDLRDFGQLREDFKEFKKGKKPAAKCNNVINEPLIPCEDQEKVIDICPPPELHLMLRSFNKIWKQLSPLWADLSVDDNDPAKTFAVQLNVVAASYHGGDFKGNGCRKILTSLDKLAEILPEELSDYLICLRHLSNIVSKCFGIVGPKDNSYLQDLENFQNSAKKIDVATPTTHSIVQHIRIWFERQGTSFGLGLYSEQAGEAVHYDFEDRVYTAAYKRLESHPQHGVKLLEAVAAYNAEHV